ncbi:MAG: DUF805 domain-containing protein [Desulfovibrionaceae bacterium]|nr:DUF805 domain-containing protein [Desulfovibrionaceae bacterium]
MTVSQAFHVCLMQKYCNFRGRAPRSEFWWFSLGVVCISIAANMLLSFVLPPQTVLWASLGLSLALVLPNIAVTVRRLHDRNLRGWWVLIPIIASLLGQPQQIGSLAMLSSALMLSMTLCFLVILALPGTKGENRFGPDPLEK